MWNSESEGLAETEAAGDEGTATGIVCPDCLGDLAISPKKPLNLLLNFPSLQPCQNGSAYWDFAFLTLTGGGPGIDAKLVGIPPMTGSGTRIVQTCFNFSAQMSGLVDFDIDISSVNPASLSYFNVIKQTDGSIDVYLEFSPTGPGPDILPLQNITFIINGQYNYSIGGNIICTPKSTRVSWKASGANQTWDLCTVNGNTTTVMVPGYSICSPELMVDAEPINDPGCQYGVNFFLEPKTSQIVLNQLKLTFLIANTVFPKIVSPSQVQSALPCANCWTESLITISSIDYILLEYWYDAATHSNVPITITSKVNNIFPMNFTAGCSRYYIVEAEGQYANQTTTCALQANLSYHNNPGWPLCSSQIYGKVVRGSNVAASEELPDHTVLLTGSNGYSLSDQRDCDLEYSFCADLNRMPFTLTTTNNNDPICGVNMLDVLLTQRHILGLTILPSVWHMIAADVNRSSSITSSDIVEMRKLILGAYTSFPLVNSWEYFNDMWVTGDPMNPSPFNPPLWNFQSVQISTTPINPNIIFRGVKMGDVNQGCSCGPKASPINGALNLQILPSKDGTAQTILYQGAESAIGLQMAYFMPGIDMNDIELTPNTSIGLSLSDFYFDSNTGELRVLWIATDGLTGLNQGEWLFKLKSKGSNAEKPIDISLSNASTQLAANDKLEAFRLIENNPSAEGIQNQIHFEFTPSLVSNATNLRFASEISGDVQIDLIHASGLDKRTIRLHHSAPISNIPIDLNNGIFGTYLVRISYQGQVLNTKLQKI